MTTSPSLGKDSLKKVPSEKEEQVQIDRTSPTLEPKAGEDPFDFFSK
jgi:hypothetical protein